MHNLSLVQALSVWSDLMTAEAGTNRYGGNVCELYIYRFMPYSPMAASMSIGEALQNPTGMVAQEVIDMYRRANQSMAALLRHFQDTRGSVVRMERPDGAADAFIPIESWDPARDPWYHRCHVKITVK